MGKKTCSVKITYTYVRTDVRPPLHESRQEIRISSIREFLAVNRMATQTFRDKKTTENRSTSFFLDEILMSTLRWVTEERAKTKDKIQR